MSFNYTEYLLNELNISKAALKFDDFKIRVYEERSFKMPREGNTLVFIVKKLTGSYVFNIKSQPVQIICYSELNTMQVALQILDYFAKTHNNHSFTATWEEKDEDDEVVSYSGLCKEDYDTVVTLRPMIDAETSFKASLYCYGSYTIIEGLSDLEGIKFWYGSGASAYESIHYISASIGYSAVLNTTKVSGQEISTSIKQEAGMVLTMRLMSDDSIFCSVVRQVMAGLDSGNTKFRFGFEPDFGAVLQMDFVLSNATFSTDRVAAPILELTFTR